MDKSDIGTMNAEFILTKKLLVQHLEQNEASVSALVRREIVPLCSRWIGYGFNQD